MDRDKLNELAADIAQGAASGAAEAEFRALLAQADGDSRREVPAWFDTAALLSLGSAAAPSPALKGKVFAKIKKTAAGIPGAGFKVIRGEDSSGWRSLAVAGASFKILSIDQNRGHAVVMGRLEAGSHYPMHTHLGPEEIYMVSGELVFKQAQGEEMRLKAGDFHRAEAGSRHGEAYSDTGCVIISILSAADLQAQMAALA